MSPLATIDPAAAAAPRLRIGPRDILDALLDPVLTLAHFRGRTGIITDFIITEANLAQDHRRGVANYPATGTTGKRSTVQN